MPTLQFFNLFILFVALGNFFSVQLFLFLAEGTTKISTTLI